MTIIADRLYVATAVFRSPVSQHAEVSFNDLALVCVWAAAGLLLTMLLAFCIGFGAETLSALVIAG
jgi:hypothetical protein